MKIVAYEIRHILLDTQRWACSSLTCHLCTNEKGRQQAACSCWCGSHTEKSGGSSEARGAGKKCKYRRLEIIHLTQSIPEIQTLFSEIQRHKEAYIIRKPFFFFIFLIFFIFFPFFLFPSLLTPPCTRTHNLIMKMNYSVVAYSCMFSYSAYNFSHQEHFHFQSYQYSNLYSGRLSAVELLCQALCRSE